MKDIQKLLKNFGEGKITVVFDDENRENEADLIVAIDKLTPEKVNFLITHAKGLVCAALSEELIKDKGLPLMPNSNTDPHSTAFTISVDSKTCKTGISPELSDLSSEFGRLTNTVNKVISMFTEIYANQTGIDLSADDDATLQTPGPEED